MIPRLGVNIDHIATIRQLRGTPYPDLLQAARIVEAAGASQITVHLREDRRHIQDRDVKELRSDINIPLNLEMAATEEMVRFASRIRPDWVCLVPEKRNEVTTEGGLDVVKNRKRIETTTQKLKKAGIKVSHFVEPSTSVMRVCAALGADAVELHTGRYCLAAQGAFGARSGKRAEAELDRIRKAAALCQKLQVAVHAGHGFDYENVRKVVELDIIEEYNIGHSIVARAVMVGLERAVREMVSAIVAP
jgi:pyridoxine 5-phosphate synthase